MGIFENLISTYGDNFSREQEDKLIAHCLSPEVLVPIEWAPIPVSANGHTGTFFVGSDALKIRDSAGDVRINVSGRGAQMLCDAFNLQLPTALMVDRIWEEASNRLTPKTYTPDASGSVRIVSRSGNSSIVSMGSISAMVAHSARVDADAKPGLNTNVGKWWILTKRIFGQPSAGTNASYKAANYGWFASGASSLSVTGKNLWQSIGTRHNQHHRDYSQVFVPVSKYMVVDGQSATVESVLRSPILAPMISHEGVLEHARHPNLPLYVPSGGVQDLNPSVDGVGRKRDISKTLIVSMLLISAVTIGYFAAKGSSYDYTF